MDIILRMKYNCININIKIGFFFVKLFQRKLKLSARFIDKKFTCNFERQENLPIINMAAAINTFNPATSRIIQSLFRQWFFNFLKW